MKKKWHCYLEEELEGEKFAKNSILLASMKGFISLTLSLLPSVDEEDRRLAVKKRLEERFVNTEKLSYLYIELLEEQGHSELVFCCYSEVEKNFFPAFLYVIPAVLLGKILKQEKLCVLYFGEAKVERYLYEKQNLVAYERLSKEDWLAQAEEEWSQLEAGQVFVLGELDLELPFDFFEKSCIWKKMKLSSLPLALDYFQGERRRKGKQKSLFRYAPYFFSSFLIASVILGFFFEYQIEKQKESLQELEAEKLSNMFLLQELEQDLRRLVEEQELWEESKQTQGNAEQKLSESLLKISQTGILERINSLEYLEDGQIRMDLFCYSFSEYLLLLSELMAQGFSFENHDSIRREKQKYQIILELREEENEKK